MITNQYKRILPNGKNEYSDGDTWFREQWVCRHCRDEREAAGLPYRFADERFSFGFYAGRYCNECWPKSGYRDAVDPKDNDVTTLHEFERGGYDAVYGENSI